MENNYEEKMIKLKAECWDAVSPTLMFLEAAGDLPPQGWDDINRIVRYYYDEIKKIKTQ